MRYSGNSEIVGVRKSETPEILECVKSGNEKFRHFWAKEAKHSGKTGKFDVRN